MTQQVGIFTFNYRWSDNPLYQLQRDIVQNLTGHEVNYGQNFDSREILEEGPEADPALDDMFPRIVDNISEVDTAQKLQSFGMMHGEWCDSVIAEYSDQYDYIIFLDMDAYPIRADAFDKLIELTEDGTTISGLRNRYYIPEINDNLLLEYKERIPELEAFTDEQLLANDNHYISAVGQQIMCVPTRLAEDINIHFKEDATITRIQNELVAPDGPYQRYWDDRYQTEPYNAVADLELYQDMAIDHGSEISNQLVSMGRNIGYMDSHSEYFRHYGAYCWREWLDTFRSDNPDMTLMPLTNMSREQFVAEMETFLAETLAAAGPA